MKDPARQFLKTFEEISPVARRRADVWRDFITLAMIALHNPLQPDQKLEQEYLETAKRYDRADLDRFSRLLALTVTMLEREPRDVLGPLYMDIDGGNPHAGQFFTPPAIAAVMGQMQYQPPGDRPFVTLLEPAAGAGGMVLAFVNCLIRDGHDPMRRLWVKAIDIDRRCAMMCYIQLALWNVPAVVIHGNTLSGEVWNAWKTPAHILGGWDVRLAKAAAENPEPVPETPEPVPENPEPAIPPKRQPAARTRNLFTLAEANLR